MKLAVAGFLVLLLAPICFAQDDDVVRVKSNLVNIDFLIKDKKGKYVPDLKTEDFTIFENGVPQKIEFFDGPLAVATRAAPNEPRDPNALPRNYVTLLLDSQTTDITNLKQVREGMLKYAREHITDGGSFGQPTIVMFMEFTTRRTADTGKPLVRVTARLMKDGQPATRPFDFVLTDHNGVISRREVGEADVAFAARILAACSCCRSGFAAGCEAGLCPAVQC